MQFALVLYAVTMLGLMPASPPIIYDTQEACDAAAADIIPRIPRSEGVFGVVHICRPVEAGEQGA